MVSRRSWTSQFEHGDRIAVEAAADQLVGHGFQGAAEPRLQDGDPVICRVAVEGGICVHGPIGGRKVGWIRLSSGRAGEP